MTVSVLKSITWPFWAHAVGGDKQVVADAKTWEI
jgi:hypothetical protein